MRGVVQRVTNCVVKVDNIITGSINDGLLIYLGVSINDAAKDAVYLAEKAVNLRIFKDTTGKMNHSVLDLDKEILVVSQFTLYADTRKGRRPSYSAAAPPEKAEELYRFFISELNIQGFSPAEGKFGAMMDVSYTNSGPVTILLDSEKQF
ncbi:MAG: D-tyrosyl-tRNA(Tyr) deacylase [Spirochaetales bacterium]|jgi:D-aminoacyl-tRNA deacylase|nr:D-tyrosyl-tRNA(Tyr) deacylase [Spirochaetales bacterium]